MKRGKENTPPQKKRGYPCKEGGRGGAFLSIQGGVVSSFWGGRKGGGEPGAKGGEGLGRERKKGVL